MVHHPAGRGPRAWLAAGLAPSLVPAPCSLRNWRRSIFRRSSDGPVSLAHTSVTFNSSLDESALDIRKAEGLRPGSIWPYLPLAINLLVCVLIYSVGLVLSARGDPLAFTRSGAAATAACVALSLWDYRRVISVAAQIEREALLATVGDICTRSQDVPAIVAALDARLRGRFGRAQRLSTAGEGCLLVVATLIWGFGDLLVR